MKEYSQTPQAKKLLKGFTMKAVKSFQGHDGDVLGGNLYYNNRLVVRAANDTWGGEMHLDVKNEKQFDKFCKLCEKLPAIKGIGCTLPELILDDMMCYFMEHKEMKRLCKKSIIVITTDCKKGEVLTYGRKYCPEAPLNHRAQMKMKHGKKLVEIVNDRYL